MALAIGIGLIAGGAVAYYLVRSVQLRLSVGSSSASLVARFTVAGAVVALLPAGFLALTAGGTLGGGAASSALGTLGVPIGVALGICIAFGIPVGACAAVFGLVGRLVARVAYGRAAI